MEILTRHVVPVQELTDEAFAPYGGIIKPRRSGDQGDRAYTFRPGQEESHVPLETHGEPCIRIMHQFKRGLVFNKVARHMHVTQCLCSLQGKEWFLAVAAATNDSSEPPPFDRITAFRIPGDRIIKISLGVWHAGPHFVHDECMFMSFENTDTNTLDFEVVLLSGECRIEA